MMVKDEHYILMIKLLCTAVPYMMVNNEHLYKLLIKLLCAGVPYDGQRQTVYIID